MRFLPQPMLRYGDPNTEVIDGVAFGLAMNGVNPSALVLVELHRPHASEKLVWKYGCAAMTSPAVVVRLDDREVFRRPLAPVQRAYDNWVWFTEYNLIPTE